MPNFKSILLLAPKPDLAQKDWDFFAAQLTQISKKELSNSLPQEIFTPLVKIFGNSFFLTRFLNQNLDQLFSYLQKLNLQKIKSIKEHTKALKIFLNDQNWYQKILFYKYQELLRITLKDIANFPTQIILLEISNLAWAIIRSVDFILLKEAKTKKQITHELGEHTLLGLGKLGGLELNYSSDVDLIAVISNSTLEKDSENSSSFFTRHLQKFTQTLNQKSGDGFLYRVDWDLRPQGTAGNLVYSFEAMLDYYQSFGQDWERQMLTKASVVSGSNKLGQRLLKELQPFIYRRFLSEEAIDQMQVLREKMYAQMKKKYKEGFHVKLGFGGIREIEFITQALCVLLGGRNPKLRVKSTLAGLSFLTSENLIPKQSAQKLTKAYLFLRKLENRLQWIDEQQTHWLSPTDSVQLEMARRMDYTGTDDQALGLFKKDLLGFQKRVHQEFLELFTPLQKSFQPAPSLKKQTAYLHLPAYHELGESLTKAKDEEEKLNSLRLFFTHEQNKIKSRIFKRKLIGKHVFAELSVLAHFLVNQALLLASQQLADRFGYAEGDSFDKWLDQKSQLLVLAMGKFGGMEMNFGSDLDLIFVYPNEGLTTGKNSISHREYFARLAQKLLSILSVPTACGRLYEIDTELRPSGKQGMLVTSLDHFIDYQKTKSQTWEKQSLLRAQTITGPHYLRRIIQDQIHQIIFDSKKDISQIKEEMALLRQKVISEKKTNAHELIDYKLGAGGLMDIEYILHFFQLTQAHKYPRLKTPNTFDGLEAFVRHHLLKNDQKERLLHSAYLFLRNLEARFSLTFPTKKTKLNINDPQLNQISHQLGFADKKLFLDFFENQRQKVHQIFKEVFEV